MEWYQVRGPRNSCVSVLERLTWTVFLRILEYYAGILFLTTNRVGDFDEAFASRIHISLYYPELNLESTREIFQLNLGMIKDRFEKKGRKIEIEQDNIMTFALQYWERNSDKRWNGRQIRNACQTALALAEFDAQGGNHERIINADAVVKLTVGHLEVVIKAYVQFMHYLKDVRDGQDPSRWAKSLNIRAVELEEFYKWKATGRASIDMGDSRTEAHKSKKQGEHVVGPATGSDKLHQPSKPQTQTQAVPSTGGPSESRSDAGTPLAPTQNQHQHVYSPSTTPLVPAPLVPAPPAGYAYQYPGGAYYPPPQAYGPLMPVAGHPGAPAGYAPQAAADGQHSQMQPQPQPQLQQPYPQQPYPQQQQHPQHQQPQQQAPSPLPPGAPNWPTNVMWQGYPPGQGPYAAPPAPPPPPQE
jgi:hypothetical protein